MNVPDEVLPVAHAPTDRPSHRTARRLALLAAGALLLPGCGLRDYEDRMSSEVVRVQRWDEETKLLGDPIKMPELPKKDGKEQSWTVFLRLPKGVSESPQTQQQPANATLAQLHGDLLAQYLGGSASGLQGVYLGVAVDQKDYMATVLRLFAPPPGVAEQSVVVKAPERDLTFRRKTFDDAQSTLSVNFYEHGNVTVAVIYRMDKGKGPSAARAIELSLATLGEGADAATNRAAYNKTNRKKK